MIGNIAIFDPSTAGHQLTNGIFNGPLGLSRWAVQPSPNGNKGQFRFMGKLKMDFMGNDWFTPNTWDTDYSQVPKSPGVYVIFSYDKDYNLELQYIGSSKNLYVRWQRHEIIRALRLTVGYVRFYFKETIEYKSEEKFLIGKYSPPLNCQFKKNHGRIS